MHGANAFNNDANFLYSDVAVAANTYERNVMYGSEAKGVALKNNCGKLNWHVNNVVHRGRIQCTSLIWVILNSMS